jgi:hypothetical protein
MEFSSNHKIKEQDDFLIELNNKEELIELSNSKNWVGCFGGCCLITIDYLDHLIDKYNILSIINKIKKRNDRECYERILGVIVCHDLQTIDNLNIFGDFASILKKYDYLYLNLNHYITYGNLPFYNISFSR